MKLQKAILILNSYQVSSASDSHVSRFDTRALLIVTFAFLICMLSVPLQQPDRVIWFAVYPIIMAPLANLNYADVFKKSLYVLPFIILIGIFNPFIDKDSVVKLGAFTVTSGWISFFTIIIRGLLAMQALVILIHVGGFINICNAINKLHVPKVFTTQLLLLYRYIGLLLEEAHSMYRSMEARGFGKSSFPLKLWTSFVGSLLVRTFEKSKRIHMAMIARGFNGSIPLGKTLEWNLPDGLFCLGWCSLFLFLHFVNLGNFFFAN